MWDCMKRVLHEGWGHKIMFDERVHNLTLDVGVCDKVLKGSKYDS